MIQSIDDPIERERVIARARLFAGSDEQYLNPEWLNRPDVYCVAQENENHPSHHEAGSLTSAFACYPDKAWFIVQIIDREFRDPVEVLSPIPYLLGESSLPMSSMLLSVPFLLFSMDEDAVFLYSPGSEYKLIAGSAEFVRAYIDNAEVDPLAELQELFQEDIEHYSRKGWDRTVKAIQSTLDDALSQVKLPPPALALE